MAEGGQNDDVMRRILASQRTIIEQNKIPLILKVKC